MSKNGHPRESEDAVEESDRSEAGADGGSDGGDSDGGDGGDGGDDADGERRRSATTGPHRAMPGIGAKRIVTGMRRSSGCSSVVRRWLCGTFVGLFVCRSSLVVRDLPAP